MMSPRWKLSCDGSWAEKSNWAWAKQALGVCKGRKQLVQPSRRQAQQDKYLPQVGEAVFWEGLRPNSLVPPLPDRWPPPHPVGLLMPAPCVSATQTLHLYRVTCLSWRPSWDWWAPGLVGQET